MIWRNTELKLIILLLLMRQTDSVLMTRLVLLIGTAGKRIAVSWKRIDTAQRALFAAPIAPCHFSGRFKLALTDGNLLRPLRAYLWGQYGSR